MTPGLLARECPTCGHRLRLVLIDGRVVGVCPLCGIIRQ